jgi:hypothetical protein
MCMFIICINTYGCLNQKRPTMFVCVHNRFATAPAWACAIGWTSHLYIHVDLTTRLARTTRVVAFAIFNSQGTFRLRQVVPSPLPGSRVAHNAVLLAARILRICPDIEEIIIEHLLCFLGGNGVVAMGHSYPCPASPGAPLCWQTRAGYPRLAEPTIHVQQNSMGDGGMRSNRTPR